MLLLALAFTAITNSVWPWLIAVMCISVTLYGVRNARLSTQIQLLFVVALSGGLGTEIVRMIYFALADMPGYVPAYRHALIVSLGSVCRTGGDDCRVFATKTDEV